VNLSTGTRYAGPYYAPRPEPIGTDRAAALDAPPVRSVLGPVKHRSDRSKPGVGPLEKGGHPRGLVSDRRAVRVVRVISRNIRSRRDDILEVSTEVVALRDGNVLNPQQDDIHLGSVHRLHAAACATPREIKHAGPDLLGTSGCRSITVVPYSRSNQRATQDHLQRKAAGQRPKTVRSCLYYDI
jgi:hypothetical protein